MGLVYFNNILNLSETGKTCVPCRWTRAQELCATWHETANLVSIHDHLENEFVTQQLAEHGAWTSAWIGYHRQRSSKSLETGMCNQIID